MQIHYALCDPSHNTGNGNYWTWYAETLSLEMLQRFYRDVVVKHLPESPFDLARPDFWDNFAPTAVSYGDWTVIYQFYSGGKDKSNRPGRYIILTAWVKTEEAEGVDLMQYVDAVFRSVGKNAKPLPMPPPKVLPKELTEKWDIKPKEPEPPSLDTYGITEIAEILADDRPQQKATGLLQKSNKGKASRLIIIIALLSFLLGMGTGTCVGVVLQYSCTILGKKNDSVSLELPLTEQKDDPNDARTGS